MNDRAFYFHSHIGLQSVIQPGVWKGLRHPPIPEARFLAEARASGLRLKRELVALLGSSLQLYSFIVEKVFLYMKESQICLCVPSVKCF